MSNIFTISPSNSDEIGIYIIRLYLEDPFNG